MVRTPGPSAHRFINGHRDMHPLPSINGPGSHTGQHDFSNVPGSSEKIKVNRVAIAKVR